MADKLCGRNFPACNKTAPDPAQAKAVEQADASRNRRAPGTEYWSVKAANGELPADDWA